MQDTYQIPAFVLTLLFLPGLGYLWLRFRERRALLWFFAYSLVVVRMAQCYNQLVFWDFSDPYKHNWLAAVGQIAIQLGSVLLVLSFTSTQIREHWPRPIWSVFYIAPLTLYAVLYYGFFHLEPSPAGKIVLAVLAIAAAAAAVLWSAQRDRAGIISRAASVPVALGMASLAVWTHFNMGSEWMLTCAETATHLMTAVLLISIGRRFSPGVMLGVLGYLGWSLQMVPAIPAVYGNPGLLLALGRCIIMGKVVSAVGLMFFALEDELTINTAAQKRERRARRELEAYSAMPIPGRRMADFDMEVSRICQVITASSRFSRAALLLLKPDGPYRLAGSAGMEGGIAPALDNLARRIIPGEFLPVGSQKPIIDGTETYALDFSLWLTPGDDLRRLNFTSCLAVPMRGQTTTEGALLLSDIRGDEPLSADDLLPTAILAARMQAIRNQTRMQEQLIESEKFAVLGQLASNVSQQLNNPLTVILGYSSLLTDSVREDETVRKGAETILSAARMMHSTIESLHRMVRAPQSPFTAVSVSEILADMEQLFRPEFQRRAINFQVTVASDLPDAVCQPQPLRQAMLHGLQYAMAAAERGNSNGQRGVRVEATAEGGKVQILVAHSGAAFANPERAFDVYGNLRPASAASAGLSLCALLIREINGRASAVNLDPSGAAILMELTAERRKRPR